MGAVILIISLLLLALAFMGITLRPRAQKKEMPTNVEERFMQYLDTYLANIKIKCKEVKMDKFKLIAEVPYEGGIFEFYRFNFELTTDRAVTDKNGIVLTTDQLLEKARFKDTPLMLFFRLGDAIFELSFVGEKEIARKGTEGYVFFRYDSIRNPVPVDDYSIILEDERIRLWDNIKGNAPFVGAVQTRERNNDILNNIAQFSDTWEGKGLRISSWVQFENRLEMIYRIRITNDEAETDRGIRVGSTVEELKEKYPQRLAYSKDFKGGGPCYGFIPDDKSNKYIAFFVEAGKVKEIWITDGFTERPFKMPKGHISDDIEWKEVDNSDKYSERYAREIYVGQHKSDFDHEKVFQSFVAKELLNLHIIETGEMSGSIGEKIYYVVGDRKNEPATVYVEVVLKRVTLLNSVTGDEIWVVDKFRSQTKSTN